MIEITPPAPRVLLQNIAHRVMIERGLAPDFAPAISTELNALTAPANLTTPGLRDLRGLLWCSIDNDDSRDLDQLSVAEALENGAVKLYVAVADVSSLVALGSAIDKHAEKNTTSVYTAAAIFPMLPEKLSTDLTSLNFNEDRRAIVIEMVIAIDGSLESSDIYEALVRNHAQLAYDSVAAWLDDTGPMPKALTAVPQLAENIRLQDSVAQKLKNRRNIRGALDFETRRAHPVFEGSILVDLSLEKTNRAKHLIEELMVAANGVTARYLSSKKFPSLRRVVRIPQRWDRILELARSEGESLPEKPDAKALSNFLVTAKKKDPVAFPDLSLCIIKLMGKGEYVLEVPGATPIGHFGLAVKDYAHSTAPNRRFPDLITQRLLKAALANRPSPYTITELGALARHCTDAEDAAKKVERQVEKSAAAVLLEPRVGEKFNAIVTGASEKGTWVRVSQPFAEGRLISGFSGLEVGDRVRVQLTHTDVERGYIDFKSAR